jgi:hypothetical protein
MTLTRSLALRMYGLLFRLLIAFVPSPEELDKALEMVDGQEDERFL